MGMGKHIILSWFNIFLFLTDEKMFEAFGFHWINITINNFAGSLLEFTYDKETNYYDWDVLYINGLISWWKNR